ncbi:MAG: ABC transporter ATP-binding protein [Caldilineaceae bacterium]|nr:ABC transporter ATP-binding protein [Caldilineaceae bacterium]
MPDQNDAAAQPLIELHNLSKRFRIQEAQRSWRDLFLHLSRRQRDPSDYFWPLRDVSFTIRQGDAVGVLGPNGSGKSTLLKLIAGILTPTAGSITVRGRVASLLELGAGFHPELTGLENIYLNGSIYGLSREEIDEQLSSIISFAELGDFMNTPVKHYSSGMYVRLGFSVAIHTNPDVLIVDEVLTVGDTHFQNKCMDAIQLFRDRGGTLLLVSHDLSTVQTICNRALWFEGGHIQADGHPVDVIMQYKNSVAERENESGAGYSHELDSSRRWGTGAALITDVKLTNEAGEERSIFYTGEPFIVRLRYAASHPLQNVIFGLALHAQHGTHVTGPNTRTDGLIIPDLAGEGEIVYRVDNLPLIEGGYALSVSLTNGNDSIMYDYHDRAYPFRVYQGRSLESHGLIALGGHWSPPRSSDEASPSAAPSDAQPVSLPNHD